MSLLLIVILTVFILYWCYFLTSSIINFQAMPVFERMPDMSLSDWPKLSIVIAACNEEDTIPTALPTLLNQDYPNLEIIVVNDRSSDGTGQCIDEFANKDSRVRAVHIDSLPENWLGKVHALHSGTQQANGDWILFTDADISLAAGTLKKAVAWGQQQQADHVTLLPGAVTCSFWLEVVMSAFRVMLIQKLRIKKVAGPDPRYVAGVGAFNLVRRDTLLKSEGLEYLKLEIADDVGLGLVIKRAGGKSLCAFARTVVNLVWYSGIRHMFAGLEKNLFPVAGKYKLSLLILLPVLMYCMVAAPLIAIAMFEPLWLAGLALASYALLTALAYIIKARVYGQFWPVIAFPVGVIIISLMYIRSGWMCFKRGGVMWRGTFYPLAQLRKHRRLDLKL